MDSQANNIVEIPSPQKQKEEILANFNTKLKNGDEWYLISSKWAQLWKTHVGFESENSVGPNPGVITNETLISFTTQNLIPILVPGATEEQDFILVPPNVGKLLHSWYNGTQITRRVIGKENQEVVELNPLVCLVSLYKDAKTPLEYIQAAFSKEQHISDLLLFAKTFYNQEVADARIWTTVLGSPYQHITNESQEMGTFFGQKKPTFCLECKQMYDWPLNFKHTRTASSYESNSSYRSSGYGSSSYSSGYSSYTSLASEPGCSGLVNLGNTCFMNSALQCLTKTSYIKDYFLNRDWKNEINYDNPLGMGGKIAKVFGELMTEMWTDKKATIVPRDFKQVIGDFQPQFSGYSQQDSQELISYLLDGLHEDLNRIVKKPSTTKPEGTIGQDEQLATDTWNVHLKRNNSVVVDHFQGLLKSTLNCPDCENVAVTFDPYMYLPLPLPVQKNRILNLTLVSVNNSTPPVEFSLLVNKNGNLKELRQQVADFAKCEPKNVILADVFNNKIYKFLSDTYSISQITDRDKTFCFVLNDLPHYAHNDVYLFDVSKETVPPFVFTRFFRLERSEHTNLVRHISFGFPFCIQWNPKMTCKEIYQQAFEFIKRFLSPQVCEQEGFDLTFPEGLFPLKDAVTKDKPDLFTLQWEGGNEEFGTELTYSDDIVPWKESYTSNNDKKGLAMFIHPWVQKTLVNAEAFEAVTKDASLSELKMSEEKGISLQDCINLFISTETLGQEDAWYCPKCKKFVQAKKKLDIWKMADVLVINLKRFQFTKYHRDKIDCLVNFPLKDLDLTDFCPQLKLEGKKYDLFAVSNHYGGLSGGHYTAYAKVGEKWYDFNDSSVSEISDSKVVSSAAYVLFYVDNSKTPLTEAKGKIFPSKEQLEEEERQKKEAEEKKKVREEEARKKKEEEKAITMTQADIKTEEANLPSLEIVNMDTTMKESVDILKVDLMKKLE